MNVYVWFSIIDSGGSTRDEYVIGFEEEFVTSSYSIDIY